MNEQVTRAIYKSTYRNLGDTACVHNARYLAMEFITLKALMTLSVSDLMHYTTWL